MSSSDIAVVGMACVFPGAKNLSQFWTNIVNGVDSITEIPQGRFDTELHAGPNPEHGKYVPYRCGGFIAHPLLFDSTKYGIKPGIVSAKDPEQLLMLDVIAAALKDADIAPDDEIRERTDVIIGRGGYPVNNSSEPHSLLPGNEITSLTTLASSPLTQEIANWLNLMGTSYTIDGDCASSLITIEQGVTRLRQNRCDAVIIGGVHIFNKSSLPLGFEEVISPSQIIRPFDRRADGLILGEGAGAIVLKRRADAEVSGNRIYGLIKGVGSTSDGSRMDITTLPSKEQVLALRRVYKDAGVEPETIGFLEGHGSGISDSDIIEIKTLKSIFGPRHKGQPLYPMGSIKSMIGHTMAAAGIASFIKAVLCLSNKIIPPSLHCQQPRTELEDIPFYINTQIYPWIHDVSLSPRRAAMNALGSDGTNTHIVLEEMTIQGKKPIIRDIKPGLVWESELVVLTAKSSTELAAKVQYLQQILEQDRLDVQLEDVAYAQYLNFVGKDSCRMALVCKDLDQLRDYLKISYERLNSEKVHFDDIDDIYYTSDSYSQPGKITFLFPGLVFPPSLLGPYVDHLQDLCLHFPEVRAIFDKADRRDGHPQDPIPTSHLFFLPEYFSEKERNKLRQRFDVSKFSNENKNPSERILAHFGIAVANWVSWILLKELDVPVDMMFGPSLGELSALCASGIIHFDELNTIYWQAPIDTINFDAKDRLAVVSTGEEELKPMLQMFPDVTIAIYGWPDLQVLGGEPKQLKKIIQLFKDQGVWAHLLPYPAAHTPGSSPLRPILEPFLENISIYRARVPVYSAITCGVYPQDGAGIRQIMIENLDYPVRFWQTIRKMYDDGARIFIQAGGGSTMHTQAKTICDEDDVIAVSLDVDYRSAITQINHLCAILITNGVALNLGYLFRHRSPRRLEISYSMKHFDRQAKDQPSHESLSSKPEISSKGEQRISTSKSGSDRRMPFIGKVLRYIPEKEIVVERILDLNEDLHLRDHLFVHAPDIKPPSACFPVLPMAVGLEVVAEVAACLVPGFGIIGFEDIKASRWITLENVETLFLRISAQLASYNPDTVTYSITTTMFVEDEASPAISATVLFGQRYLQSIDLEFEELINPRPCPLKAEEIYRDRRLFHGSTFQCISGDMVLGDQGLIGELTILPKDHLFASTKTPELLTDPIILDGAGQLIGVWAQGYEMYIFPIGVRKLEIFCPTPPVGTHVPVRLQITHLNSKTLYTDIEIQDGKGRVWMRIENWGDWVFHWPKKIFNFRRLSTKYVITQDIHLPYLPKGSICQAISKNDLRHFELGLGLAVGFYLHIDEMDTFRKLGNNPVRQLQWLLGRIVAKESVRLWLAKEAGKVEMLHPASFVIENDSKGQPFIRSSTVLKKLPKISIAHSNDRAIAVASRDAVGIDLELISHRDDAFLESFTTPKERDILNRFPTDVRNGWITRLWCAKEAVGKALGKGLNRYPQSFELHDIAAAEGRITIHYRESDRLFSVYTQQDKDFIIVYTSP